jgi:hypothetical protein
MFRSVLVALVAMFALGAMASASALAAAPEFVTTAFPITYSGTSGEVTLQTTESHTKGNITIHCSASADSGEIAEAHSFKFLLKVHIVYTGCKVGTGTTVCTSKGAAAGEIVTNALKAQLVYTNKAAKEVGLVFKPEAAGGAVAEYTCGVLIGKVKLSGAVVTKLAGGQLGKAKTSFTWNYRQKAGIQEPTEYEEGATKVSAFLTSAYGTLSEQTGEETTETLSFSGAVEVIA